MGNVVRVALPGYNALTDTNLDHFSLYSDVDNILIKRFITKVLTSSVSSGNATDTNNANPVYGGSGTSGESNQGQGQSFIATGSLFLNMTLKVFKVGSPTDNFIVTLKDSLTGAALGSVSTSAASLTSGAYNTFTFSSIAVTAGGVYYLEFTRDGARDTSNYIEPYFAFNTSPYTQGNMYHLQNGAWVFDSNTSSYSFTVNFDAKMTIPHGLDYIPFFVVSDNDQPFWVAKSGWEVTNNKYNQFSVPDLVSAVDTQNLYVINSSNKAIQLAIDVFYDDMSQTGTPNITESKNVLKVGRPGKDVLTSKNPNDYIMHSDLNNFKILLSNTVSLTGISPGVQLISVDYTKFQNPAKVFVFIKFPDGKTLLAGASPQLSYDATWQVQSFVSVGGAAGQIALDFEYGTASSGTIDVTVTYIVYGSGIDGTVIKSSTQPIIAVAAPGKDVTKETNPDSFNFHSNYPTLKYFSSGSFSTTVTTTTIHTIAHNLSYVPFFIGFVQDLANIPGWNGNSEPVFALCPFYWGRSNLVSPNQDILASVYADDTNMYLVMRYQTNAVGTSQPFDFYYKIFKNNLGL